MPSCMLNSKEFIVTTLRGRYAERAIDLSGPFSFLFDNCGMRSVVCSWMKTANDGSQSSVVNFDGRMRHDGPFPRPQRGVHLGWHAWIHLSLWLEVRVISQRVRRSARRP
jgi:hypothetical protein